MHFTGSVHPPAGIDPLMVVVNDMSRGFLVAPVGIGAILLAFFAFAWHSLVARRSRPVVPSNLDSVVANVPLWAFGWVTSR
jgi:CBS-domain-containing membrane protein